jgi:hypothetical protein
MSLNTHQYTTAVMGLLELIEVNKSLNTHQWPKELMGLIVCINVSRSLNTKQRKTSVMGLAVLIEEKKSRMTKAVSSRSAFKRAGFEVQIPSVEPSADGTKVDRSHADLVGPELLLGIEIDGA